MSFELRQPTDAVPSLNIFSLIQVATTPVSMSYSEWISNYSTGGWGSKHVHTRVQESAGSLSDVEDSPGMAVYSIMYGEGDVAKPEKYNMTNDEATVIEVSKRIFMEPNYSDFTELLLFRISLVSFSVFT